MRPAVGKPCWLVKRGHGSFVTMEFGEPQVEVSGPYLRRVFIEGAPQRSPRRSAFVRGDWHLWIYCCRWSLTLEGIQLGHQESDATTMNRALAVLNGQILTAVQIEPDSRTTFCFDLGCTFLTYPAPAGTYRGKPTEQWFWYGRSGPVAVVRDNGTYALIPRGASLKDERGQAIATPLHVAATT
jgi:hypothetical protein